MLRGLLIAAMLLMAAPPCKAQSHYHIGSSYLWDAHPHLISGATWHIYCGKPLGFILLNPYGHCVRDSVPWIEGLLVASPDHVSFQPVPTHSIPNSTSQEDISAIMRWLADVSPETVAILHPTWPTTNNPDLWAALYYEPEPNHLLTNYTPEYYDFLLSNLRVLNPGRTIISDRGNEMMAYILNDPNAAFSFVELFRDANGHMADLGRYLQHNALRQALGEPTGVDPTSGIDAASAAYLDSVVALHQPIPEPRVATLLLSGVAMLGGLTASRRMRRARGMMASV